MKITKDWLKKKSACALGVAWFNAQQETDGATVVKKLMLENHFDWANWLIVRVMERKQCLAYAIFAAEQVLDIFEKKYPGDKRPRLAIKAAKQCLEKDTPENRADAAGWADAAGSWAAGAAAGYAADRAADAAAWAAGDADAAARENMQIKILNYGIKLLEPGK